MVTFVGKQEMSQELGLSRETLKRYRLQGEWIEGVHWIRVNCRRVLYNQELIQDWLHNRNNPNAHQCAIEIYQSSRLSSKKIARNRSAQVSV
ncbi:hypothetical protein LEP3755_44570 [Leptolyngbya sp. NIES-3755]|nr:hypothetical protein LEP3755_44570 [Leptolyngbya sp. NIES-3755]